MSTEKQILVLSVCKKQSGIGASLAMCIETFILPVYSEVNVSSVMNPRKLPCVHVTQAAMNDDGNEEKVKRTHSIRESALSVQHNAAARVTKFASGHFAEYTSGLKQGTSLIEHANQLQ